MTDECMNRKYRFPQSLLKNLWIKKGNLARDFTLSRAPKDKAVLKKMQ